jgi:hypothetical protein
MAAYNYDTSIHTYLQMSEVKHAMLHKEISSIPDNVEICDC